MQVAALVIGDDLTVTLGGQSGNFELNVMMPVMAHQLLESHPHPRRRGARLQPSAAWWASSPNASAPPPRSSRAWRCAPRSPP